MLNKLTTKQADQPIGDSNPKFEVLFSLKPDLKHLSGCIYQFLNKLTGYNHMMTLNEQLVKHQLRTKFVLEAMSIL